MHCFLSNGLSTCRSHCEVFVCQQVDALPFRQKGVQEGLELNFSFVLKWRRARARDTSSERLSSLSRVTNHTKLGVLPNAVFEVCFTWDSSCPSDRRRFLFMPANRSCTVSTPTKPKFTFCVDNVVDGPHCVQWSKLVSPSTGTFSKCW